MVSKGPNVGGRKFIIETCLSYSILTTELCSIREFTFEGLNLATLLESPQLTLPTPPLI